MMNKDWLRGFIDGEGCFFIGINVKKDMSAGKQVLPEFRIVQHKRDTNLLYDIRDFFNCGRVVKNKKDGSVMEFRVRSIKDINSNIIPFFKDNPLLTNKRFDLEDFIAVIDIINKKQHLTISGLLEIEAIKNKMNTKRFKKG